MGALKLENCVDLYFNVLYILFVNENGYKVRNIILGAENNNVPFISDYEKSLFFGRGRHLHMLTNVCKCIKFLVKALTILLIILFLLQK